MKSLYTALPYPFSSKEFVVKLWGSPFQWKERKFKVFIKLVNNCTVIGGDIQIGRSLFFSFGTGGDIGGGFEFWRGYYQSLRPTQFGLSLNIDVSAKAFYQSTLVTEFVQQHFNYRDISKGLSNREIRLPGWVRGTWTIRKWLMVAHWISGRL
ncbi:protein argonaute 12-like [Rosa rugosa]|uniref:protein argonaute 12-like n=1 Tax=Rosa rugosa TaxID=74645 RepID=UPI002B40BD0B|nr:protein argonaute 12-like [Rosa rugosa]